MKNSEVQIGATYLVKVAGNLVPVKITCDHDNGGWEGTSLKTRKTIRIKSARRLRKLLADASWSTSTPEENRRRHADQSKAIRESGDGMAEKQEWESQNMRLRMVRELQVFLRDAAKDAATLVVGGYDEQDYANLLDAREAAANVLKLSRRLPHAPGLRIDVELAAAEDDGELVPEKDACPKCGERNIDKLVWDTADYECGDKSVSFVKCQSCSHEYVPQTEK